MFQFPNCGEVPFLAIRKYYPSMIIDHRQHNAIIHSATACAYETVHVILRHHGSRDLTLHSVGLIASRLTIRPYLTCTDKNICC
jgi:hypothetical protein